MNGSPPARGRGLKQGLLTQASRRLLVAPRAGAWIETTGLPLAGTGCDVAPRAGAWIETYQRMAQLRTLGYVAPRAGAWIETYYGGRGITVCEVAPRAGAWIETTWPLRYGLLYVGRPPRGGGD